MWGFSETMKQITQMKHYVDKISQLGGCKPVGYFRSMAEDLYSWLPRTNQASRQGGTWTEGLQITSPALANLAMLNLHLLLSEHSATVMIYKRSKIIVSVTYDQHFLHHLFSHFLSQLFHSLVKIIISIAALTTWQSKRRRVTNHYAAFTDNSSTNINKANTILFFR